MDKKEKKEKSQTMCGFKRGKMLGEQFELYRSIVSSPAFFCRKCARVATDGRWLCKPQSLTDGAE